MKKVNADVDIKISAICPYCDDENTYKLDELETQKGVEVEPIESILRGIVRRYQLGLNDITDTSFKCKKCKKVYVVNRIEVI